jgi:hypothetical protein
MRMPGDILSMMWRAIAALVFSCWPPPPLLTPRSAVELRQVEDIGVDAFKSPAESGHGDQLPAEVMTFCITLGTGYAHIETGSDA